MFKTLCRKQLVYLLSSLFILTATMGLITPTAQAADTKLTFGTGGKGGYYFRVGDLLCKSFAQGTDGFKCRARTTDGPRENLPNLRSGKFDFVVARSDWAKSARDGSGFFKGKGADSSLRSLFSIHSEPLTVIARKGSGISLVNDLDGKRVKLGVSASRLVRQLPHQANWDTSAFDTFKPGDLSAQRKALCSGEIDAVARVVAYPSGWVQKTAQTCPIQLVELSSRQINSLVAGTDTLSKATIPANVYTGVTRSTMTFGYKAALLSSTNVSDNDVYAFVKFTFENLPQLGQQNPALTGLQPSEMIRDSMVVPLHPGAVRYYREQGWIK